jgi:hypothetical protein
MGFTSALVAIMVFKHFSRYPYRLYIVDQNIHMVYCDLGLNNMAPLWHMRPRQIKSRSATPRVLTSESRYGALIALSVTHTQVLRQPRQ